MPQEYIKIFVIKETKKAFNDFYEANKSLFVSKSNMFRVMIANLPTLAKLNNKIIDPEKQKLEKELQEAKEKILEYESKLNVSNAQNENIMSPEIIDKLERMEIMISKIYESDLVTLNKTGSNSTTDFDFKF